MIKNSRFHWDHALFNKYGARVLVLIVAATAIYPPLAHADWIITEGDAVLPGVSIFQDDNSGGEAQCTAGFVVAAPDGQRGFLTAGHCAVSSKAVSMPYRPTHQIVPIGKYKASVLNDDHDIALVGVYSDVPVNSHIGGIKGVVDYAEPAALVGNTETEVCMRGAVSDFTCGRTVKVTGNNLVFTAPATHGDSGAPVYARRKAGGVTAIGIVVSHPGGDETLVMTEFIAPWLKRWSLTLD